MRLAPPDLSNLGPEQQKVHDAVAASPRGAVRGPLAIWLHNPRLADRAQALGEYCRYRTSLDPRLSELAILVTARLWSAEFEWWAHKGHGLDAGLAPETIEAIRTGRRPEFDRADEAAVHDFVRELNDTRRMSDGTYVRAMEVLGREGVVDLVGIAGYYTLISMTLNVFEVRQPDDAPPELGSAR